MPQFKITNKFEIIFIVEKRRLRRSTRPLKSTKPQPSNPGKKTRDEIENAVVDIRKTLMDGNEHESKYLGVSADAILYSMHNLGFSDGDKPSTSTINRIIKKHKLKVNKRERYKRVKSKKIYTILNPTRINEVHQIDFVGPRFIKGYGAISSINLIDVVSNQVHIENFNKWFGEKFWAKEIFVDLEDIRTKSTHFVDQYNALSVWKKRNKELEMIETVRMLKDIAETNFSKLLLIGGKVHFIRQVDNDGRINVLNETFVVGNDLISEYVWATICLRKQRLGVYYRAQDQDVAVLIKEFDYGINEEVRSIRNNIWKVC